MKNVTGDFVNESKKNGNKLLVQYTASWCNPCRMLTPRLERIENEYENISFVKVDVEQNMEHVAELLIISVPTVIVYNGEEIIHRGVGLNSEEYYRDILNKL